MALSKREIEIQIGRLARKTPMAATTYGRDMTRARVGWILSEHGKRAAFPSMEENCSLLLGMALGPPAEAVANQRYGALRLETSQTVAGDLLVSTQSFGGALEGELVLAGVPCADTVLKTMAAYAMAFTGPAREALSAVTCTVRFVKDDWFPYAAIEIIDGSRRHELLYWPANISLLMETGVPPRERTIEESVTLWPAVFRGLADVWLATRAPTVKSSDAGTLAGEPAPHHRPHDSGRSTPTRKAHLDKRDPSARARACSSPDSEGRLNRPGFAGGSEA
jgi:hypothetical protein